MNAFANDPNPLGAYTKAVAAWEWRRMAHEAQQQWQAQQSEQQLAAMLAEGEQFKQSFLDKAMEKIKWSLNKMVEKQKLSQADADKIFARITPIVDLKEALKNADLLIEAVPEDMNLKKKVYADVDKYAK